MFQHEYFMTTCFMLPCLSSSSCYSVFKQRRRRKIAGVAMGTNVIQKEFTITAAANENWAPLMPPLKFWILCIFTSISINKQPTLRGSQVVACKYLACALWLWWSWWSEWWSSPPRWAARTWYSLILSDWQQLRNLKPWWAGLVIWLSLLTRSAPSQAQLASDWW